MEKYTEGETELINSLNKPVNDVDMNLVDSVIDKMLLNEEYDNLLNFLNALNDFSNTSKNIVDKLITENNKKCISIFLENESSLYFLNKEKIMQLKIYLGVSEVNIKLDKPYDYYYKLLFNQGVRLFKTVEMNDNEKLEFISAKEGAILDAKGNISIRNINSGKSYVRFTYMSASESVYAEGILFSVTFKALEPVSGTTNLEITIPNAADLVDNNLEKIPYSVENAEIITDPKFFLPISVTPLNTLIQPSNTIKNMYKP